MTTLVAGDFGIPLHVVITDEATGLPMDLTGVTSVEIHVVKPTAANGKVFESVTWEATVYGTPTNGTVRHYIANGELDAAGPYTGRVVTKTGTTTQISTSILLIEVAKVVP